MSSSEVDLIKSSSKNIKKKIRGLKINLTRTKKEDIWIYLGFGDDFLVQHAKDTTMKKIIDKPDLIKIKNFCSVKDTVKKLRGNP